MVLSSQAHRGLLLLLFFFLLTPRPEPHFYYYYYSASYPFYTHFFPPGTRSHLVTVSGPGDLYLQTRGERKTRAQRMREERMEMEVLEDEIERKALERARD
jgi:hypothetical protein